jgi:penicillin-binding protein 1A
LRPTDHFVDKPIRIGKWEPHNFEGRYRGDMTVAEALADSVNTVAVQVLERTGVDNVINAARQLGITANLPRDASLALGTGEVSLIDLTGAYAAFASGGVAAWPYGIVEVRDAHGGVLFRRAGSGAGRVIDPAIAGTMNEMLMGVIAHGTGKNAQLDRPAAGKTGTTQDSHDALFVGYTADLVAGVWFGNDDNSPMHAVTGGTLPARTWKNFMLAATKDTPIHALPLAQGGREVAAAPERPAGPGILGGLNRLLHSIFGGGSGVPPPERQSP